MKTKILLPILSLLYLLPLRAEEIDDKPLPGDDPKAVELFKACERGDLDTVKQLVNTGAPLDGHVTKMELTPLITAVIRDRNDVVDFLIASKAKLDATDALGGTALLHATFEKQSPDLALKLIDAGADVNIGSRWGQTPLMHVCQTGNDKVLQALIAHKVDVNANCEVGPAILWAASNDRTNSVKLLIDAGADVNLLAQSKRSRYSALGCAASNGNHEMLNLLLAAKADPNEHDNTGTTALMAAADWRRDECVSRLVEAGADINAKNNFGNTALLKAADRGDEAMVRLLLDKGADPNIADSRGETALTISGERGNTEIVEVLKEKGATRTDIHVIAKDDPVSPVPPAREWALAVGAIYTQRAGLDTKVLGSNEGPDPAKTMLKRDWGITDKETLMSRLDSLIITGHRATLQKDGAAYAAMSDEDFEKLTTGQPQKAGSMKALRACYQKWKERTGLAWDMCRAVNVINSSFAAKFITEDEAWTQLMRVARVTQPAFSSWQEMSDNFLDAREVWSNGRDPKFEACSKVLLNSADPNSPWTINSWNTSLAAN